MKLKHSRSGGFARVVSIVTLLGLAVANSPAQTVRVLGLDISAWQGNISQTTWDNIRNVENRQFVVLRSSRGGTTGYYNQNDSDNSEGNNTLSQRYDDPYFIQNVNRATAAGIFVGSYHFSRPDIISSTLNSGGIPNSGTDEADHFIEMAGPWMRPGYLWPVHDFEAGDGLRTDNEMAQFCIDFSDRVYEKMGIRPAIYTSGNYAANILGGASASLRDLIAKPSTNWPTMTSPAYPVLWSARWPNQTDPNSIDVQNGEPKDSYAPIYGPWDDYGVTHPWVMWQYASTLRLQSFNNGGNNLDADVVRGGVEFLKDQLVPALWWHDSSGDWSTLTNWNSGQTPVMPVPGTNQVAPVGTLTLPVPRLPGAAGPGVISGQNDTVILERPNADITVTVSSGIHTIRKLYMRETLNITGGTLTVNHLPSPDSTTNAAQFSGPATLSGGMLSLHTMQVDSARTLTVSGGTLRFLKINLMPGTSPAILAIHGNPALTPLSGTGYSIVNGSGGGSSGRVDLGAGNRTLSIPTTGNLSVEVPIQNGGLIKSGLGILRVSAASTYAGGTEISAGKFWANNTTGSGTGTGAVTVNGGTLGGSGIISGVVTVNAGGTLAPGTDSAIGTLTLQSSPVLNGTTSLRINWNNGSPLSDRVSRTGGSLTYGGALVVSNAGSTLTGGEVFTLFSATTYGGAFTSTNLPALGVGLNWYLGDLMVNGTLHVNRRPSATWAAFDNSPGQTLSIPISSIIGTGNDPDGNALSLSAFDSISTNGITLTSDGTNIYYLNNADVPDRFGYTLTDGRGGVASGMVLIGHDAPSPPLILSGPVNAMVVAGQNATFNVAVSGTPPMSYQWRFNGANIDSATSSSYTRFNVQAGHQGGYSVVVTNAYGSITSSVATLTLAFPAVINVQPQSTHVALGQNATFSVGAGGTSPLYYQWRFKGNTINGATTSSLTLNGVTSNQFGGYSVVVSNAYGVAISETAALGLTPTNRLQLLWKIPPGTVTHPFLTSAELPEQRGMTFNPVTRRLLVVNRMTPTVHVMNEHSTNLWTLNTSTVTGGLNANYYLLLIAAADDGAIYACNLKASSNPFKIYRWADDSSNTVPSVIFSGDPSPGTPSYRWGDTFDVRGTGTNTQILIGPRAGTNVVLFTTTNGLDFTPRVINLNGIVPGDCGLNVTFGNGNTFWGDSHTNVTRHISFDPVAGTGSVIRVYSNSEIPNVVSPIGYSPSLNMLAGIYTDSPNHLRVYDLSPTNGVPSLMGTTNFASDNSNTHTGTGAVRFNGDVIYALEANNGLMAVRIIFPTVPVRFDEVLLEPGPLLTLRGTGTTGSYVVQGSSPPLTNWTSIGNLDIGISGSFEFTKLLTNNAHQFYRLQKQ